MATCLRLPVVYKPHPSFRPPSRPSLRQLRRPSSFITNSILPPRQSSSSSRKPIPEPPLIPDQMIEDDLFLSRLQDVADERPDMFYRARDSNVPPLLNVFEPPTSMASPAETEYAGGGGRRRYRRRRKSRPPTLASLLLHGRIVYIGLPLVPVVTELIVAQLMYLHMKDPYDPIALYINSTGTTGDDGEPLALDYDGFAIYDALMQFKNTRIHTFCFGCAVGHACLLLACGTKGKRYALPHAKAAIHPPVAPPSGLLPAIDALSSANEVVYNRDLFTKLFARHTGNTVEAVAEKMKGTYYMDVREATKFGVIDHVIWDKQEEFMKFILPPEEYPKPEQKKKKKRVYKPINDL